MKKLFFVLLPKNLVSHLMGRLAALKLKPRALMDLVITQFAQAYNINLAEAEKPVSQYQSLNDFFTRKLKNGVRPLHSQEWIHPCDSQILQLGTMTSGRCIQAKGREYYAHDLTLASVSAESFITYYLCPTDYHRVHSPVSGRITSMIYIPGNLWPVNFWSVDNIEKLYCVNERVVVEIENEKGLWHVVFVGATNVGQITLAFDPEIRTNSQHTRKMLKKVYEKPIPVKIGEELGVFNMGSTVVLLAPVSVAASKNKIGDKVKLGEAFR